MRSKFSRFYSSKDLYKVLQVDSNSDAKAIKSSFYRLSKIHHPDLSGSGSAEKFLEIKSAYEILSNELKRAEYDQNTNRNSVYSAFNNSRDYRNNLNPDDYIQFRTSGKRHGFDHKMHQDYHYGRSDKDINGKTREDILYYRELYERKQFKPHRMFLLFGFGMMLYYSDLIQALFI